MMTTRPEFVPLRTPHLQTSHPGTPGGFTMGVGGHGTNLDLTLHLRDSPGGGSATSHTLTPCVMPQRIEELEVNGFQPSVGKWNTRTQEHGILDDGTWM